MYLLFYFIYRFFNPVYTKLTVAIVSSFIYYTYLRAETLYDLTNVTSYLLLLSLFLMIFIKKKNNITISEDIKNRGKLESYTRIFLVQVIIIFISFVLVALIFSFQNSYPGRGFAVNIGSLTGKELINAVILFPWLISIFFAICLIYVIKIKREPFWVKIAFDDPKRHPALFIHNAFCGMTYLYSSASLIFIVGILVAYFCWASLDCIGINIFRSPIVATMSLVASTGGTIIFNFIRPKYFFLRKLGVISNTLLMAALTISIIFIVFVICDLLKITDFYSGLDQKAKLADLIVKDQKSSLLVLFIVMGSWFSQAFSGTLLRESKDLSVKEMIFIPMILPTILCALIYNCDVLDLIKSTQYLFNNKVIGIMLVMLALLMYLYQYKNVRNIFSLYVPGVAELIQHRKNLLEYYKFFFPLISVSVGIIIFNGWYGVILTWGSTYSSYLFTIWLYMIFGLKNTYSWLSLPRKQVEAQI